MKAPQSEATSQDSSPLVLNPIGFIHTQMKFKFDARHQPRLQGSNCSKIDLLPDCNFEQALRDLEGFDRIWIVWWFHKNKNWKPMVRPPRGPNIKRGVFATRSPHRPNPIGISSVQLIKIKGRSLIVGETDLVDGTPILDIKPYIKEIDSFPDARCGWVETLHSSQTSAYTVCYSTFAREQIAWLQKAWQLNFWQKAEEMLAIDPRPHRTRRITKERTGGFRISCGSWRIFFSVNDKSVQIERIGMGYNEQTLQKWGSQGIVDYEAQRAFLTKYAKKTKE